jgi:hypothetical protein
MAASTAAVRTLPGTCGSCAADSDFGRTAAPWAYLSPAAGTPGQEASLTGPSAALCLTGYFV